jgi:hypothetical protein
MWGSVTHGLNIRFRCKGPHGGSPHFDMVDRCARVFFCPPPNIVCPSHGRLSLRGLVVFLTRDSKLGVQPLQCGCEVYRDMLGMPCWPSFIVAPNASIRAIRAATFACRSGIPSTPRLKSYCLPLYRDGQDMRQSAGFQLVRKCWNINRGKSAFGTSEVSCLCP